MSKEDEFQEVISEDFNPDYEAKKQRFFSVIKSVINIDAKDTFEILSGEQKTSNNFWNYAEAAGALVLQNPLILVNTGSAVVYNRVIYGDNYVQDAKELAQTLKTGKESDSKTSPFLLNIINDSDTIDFLQNNENASSVTKLIEVASPTLISFAFKKFGKIKDSTEQQDIIVNQNREDVKILKEVLKKIPIDQAEIITEQKKMIVDLEKKIKSFDQRNNRAILIRDLAEAGIDTNYVNNKIIPILIPRIENLLKDPERLMSIAQLTTKRFFITDPAEKKQNLVDLLDNINVPEILAKTQISLFLTRESETLVKGGEIFLYSNEKFKDLNAKLHINNDLVRDTLSVGIKIAAASTENEAAFTAIYEKLKPVILNNSVAEKVINTNDPVELAKIERDSLIKKLELAGSVANLLNSHSSSQALNEIPTLLKNNSASIGIMIINAQENYPNSSLSKIIRKTAPGGKIDAEEGAKLINSLAHISKVTLPIISNLAKESLSHPDDLADIIDQTKKVLHNKENSRKAEAVVKEIKTSFLELKGNSVADTKNDPNKLLKIVTQTEQLLDFYDVKSKKAGDKQLQNLNAALLDLKTKSTHEKLTNPEKLLDIVKKAENLLDTHQLTKKDEIKNLIAMLSKFKNEHQKIGQIIDKDLPKLLQDNKEEIGEILDNFLNQTKIGKKLNLEGKDILAVAAKKTPALIEVAELYAQNKYAAIIPKAVKILADKQVLELAVRASINFVTSTTKDEAEKIGAKINGKYVNSTELSQSSNPILQKKRSTTMKIGG